MLWGSVMLEWSSSLLATPRVSSSNPAQYILWVLFFFFSFLYFSFNFLINQLFFQYYCRWFHLKFILVHEISKKMLPLLIHFSNASLLFHISNSMLLFHFSISFFQLPLLLFHSIQSSCFFSIFFNLPVLFHFCSCPKYFRSWRGIEPGLLSGMQRWWPLDHATPPWVLFFVFIKNNCVRWKIINRKIHPYVMAAFEKKTFCTRNIDLKCLYKISLELSPFSNMRTSKLKLESFCVISLLIPVKMSSLSKQQFFLNAIDTY